jgi:glycerol-3-phosphate responsive antiterminator
MTVREVKFAFVNQKTDLLTDSGKITIREQYYIRTIRESLQQRVRLFVIDRNSVTVLLPNKRRPDSPPVLRSNASSGKGLSVIWSWQNIIGC